MSGVDLDAEVRQSDPDRWLSSRFVPDPIARADLIALYAFEAELLAIPKRVTQPLLAEMRFTWWSEQMDGLFAGLPRKGHPVLEALGKAQARRPMDRGVFDRLIEAHIGRVQGQSHDLEAFYGGPMREAARLLGADDPDQATAAGRVWGLSQTGRHDEARAGLADADRSARSLPVAAFPAVLPATLARAPDAGPASKRARLLWATVRGRL